MSLKTDADIVHFYDIVRNVYHNQIQQGSYITWSKLWYFGWNI